MTESPKRETYRVEVAGLTRDLPLFEVAPGVRIAVVNILGDVELVQASAEVLTPLLLERRPETLLTAETKSIPLVHVLAAMMNRPYVVLRKSYKPYMGAALSCETFRPRQLVPIGIYLKSFQVVQIARSVTPM